MLYTVRAVCQKQRPCLSQAIQLRQEVLMQNRWDFCYFVRFPRRLHCKWETMCDLLKGWEKAASQHWYLCQHERWWTIGAKGNSLMEASFAVQRFAADYAFSSRPQSISFGKIRGIGCNGGMFSIEMHREKGWLCESCSAVLIYVFHSIINFYVLFFILNHST